MGRMARIIPFALVAAAAVIATLAVNFLLVGYAQNRDDPVGKLSPRALITDPVGRTGPATTSGTTTDGTTTDGTTTEGTTTEEDDDDSSGRGRGRGRGRGGGDDD